MNLTMKVLILFMFFIACKANANDETFNEVIKSGVTQETREVLKTCLLFSKTVHNDVVASGTHFVFKCSGLDQEIITLHLCDNKCNLPESCFKRKHYRMETEWKVLKVQNEVDQSIHQIVLPVRCHCKVQKNVGHRRRTRGRKGKRKGM